MNKLVEDYLNKKANEIAAFEQKKKDDLLIDIGLYEKEYSANSTYSDEYPENEWDSETNTTRFYRKIPIEVSDEEYLEIMKYQNRMETEEKTNNTVSIVFKFIAGIIFVMGFIAGIVFGQTEVSGYYSSHTEFTFTIALTYWAISFFSGMIFIGFAEIIQLLYDIKMKLLRGFH